MTTNTKLADLPAKWLATAEAARSAAVSASFTECADELESALSQQPSAAGVPEWQDPVAWTVQDQLDKVATGEVGFISRKDMVDPAPNVPLYTAPPAQAVDLLRRAVPFINDEAAKYDDDGSNEPLELAREIEALIDQQAGKGAR